jgi:hypothetical protein
VKKHLHAIMRRTREESPVPSCSSAYTAGDRGAFAQSVKKSPGFQEKISKTLNRFTPVDNSAFTFNINDLQ